MKISIDGGALCESKNRYGNYTFSRNLIAALYLYDKKNDYIIYGFCKKPLWLKERQGFHYRQVLPKKFWLSVRLSLEQLLHPTDIYLALNQAIPFYTSGKAITFCHGLAYYFYPQYYSKNEVTRLNRQLTEMIKHSDKIIVSSEKVKKELISINQLIKKKIYVIPFGVPFDMDSFIKKDANYVKNKYFLYVGMDHQIKNIEFIKQVFNEFKKNRKNKDYELKIVTENIDRNNLKELYQNATALLTVSYYESFNLPVLEALSQGCPVISLKSSIIPELKNYVNIATDKKTFIKLMTAVNKNNLKTKFTKETEKKFSWKNYVRILRETSI